MSQLYSTFYLLNADVTGIHDRWRHRAQSRAATQALSCLCASLSLLNLLLRCYLRQPRQLTLPVVNF